MVGNEEEREYVASEAVPWWRAGGRRVSWGAIFAGAVVTLAVFLTLQILGAGIGLSTINLTNRGASNAQGLGIGALVWWFVMGLISLFIGGWTAGKLGWRSGKIDRMLHGLTVWSVFYIVMFWLAATALSALVGGGIALIGGAVSSAGQAAAPSPQVQQTVEQALENRGLSPDAIRQEIAKAMGAAASPQNRQAIGNLVGTIGDYLQGPRTPQDRQETVQAITQATGMNPAQANRLLTNLERAEQQARETGQQAANVTGATFIGLAIAMIIGAIVAMLGSLAATAPSTSVPPYEHEHIKPAERAYAATR